MGRMDIYYHICERIDILNESQYNLDKRYWIYKNIFRVICLGCELSRVLCLRRALFCLVKLFTEPESVHSCTESLLPHKNCYGYVEPFIFKPCMVSFSAILSI